MQKKNPKMFGCFEINNYLCSRFGGEILDFDALAYYFALD